MTDAAPERRLLDYRGVAVYLSIGKRGVEKLAAAGELPKVTGITNKVLFDKVDVDAYVDRMKRAQPEHRRSCGHVHIEHVSDRSRSGGTGPV